MTDWKMINMRLDQIEQRLSAMGARTRKDPQLASLLGTLRDEVHAAEYGSQDPEGSRSPIDRSLAFTALLDQGMLAGISMSAMTERVTSFLHDYYRSADRYRAAEQKMPAMYEFARNWEPVP